MNHQPALDKEMMPELLFGAGHVKHKQTTAWRKKQMLLVVDDVGWVSGKGPGQALPLQ